MKCVAINNKMNIIFYFVIMCFFCCCKQQEDNEIAQNRSSLSEPAITVFMESKVYTIQQNNLEPPIKSVFKKDSIFLLFWEDKNPMQFNVNLTGLDLLSSEKATYKIPESNIPKIKADLNFFIANRNVKRMNKRILFKKGIIEIKKITNSKLQLTFEGEGCGMMERGNLFPISGKINVNY